MFGLFSKLMNGIVSLLDKINCNVTCCSNTINVSIPSVVCSECSRRSNNSEELHVEGREVAQQGLSLSICK